MRSDPDHEQHQDIVQFSGGGFDVGETGIDGFVQRLDRPGQEISPAAPQTKDRNVGGASARILRRRLM